MEGRVVVDSDILWLWRAGLLPIVIFSVVESRVVVDSDILWS